MPLDQSFRGLLSVHSRYGLHARQVAYATLYTGGSDGFVSFTAAPIATGWSEQFPGGTFTRSEPAPFTAHVISQIYQLATVLFPAIALKPLTLLVKRPTSVPKALWSSDRFADCRV